MPMDIGDAKVRQALQDGNSQLASVRVAELLRDAHRLGANEVAGLHCQAAAAEISCGRLSEATEHIEVVRGLSDLSAVTTATAAILLAAVACCTVDDIEALEAASDFINSELARTAAPAELRVRMHLAGMRCDFALRRLDAARVNIAALRSDSAAQVHWIESQVLIAEANLMLLEGQLGGIKAVVTQILPVVTAMGPCVAAASTWWEVAEIARAAGLHEDAWQAATRAIDCSSARPADRHSTFAPGVLMWAAGT